MMYNERRGNCGDSKALIVFCPTLRRIISSADCWSLSGVTLLTLLSFYVHTKDKQFGLLIGEVQNRAIMESVNSVYTRRVDAAAASQTAWYFAPKLRTATRSSPAPREAAEDVAATVSQIISPEVGRNEGVGS